MIEVFNGLKFRFVNNWLGENKDKELVRYTKHELWEFVRNGTAMLIQKGGVIKVPEHCVKIGYAANHSNECVGCLYRGDSGKLYVTGEYQ